jgi:hypothetical protein
VGEAHSPPLGIMFLGVGVNFRRHGRRLRRLMWGQKNFAFGVVFGNIFYSYILDIFIL